MTIISLGGFAFTMLILAVIPGPGVFAIVSRALASGFRSALGMIAGMICGDIIYLMFAVFGLSAVAQVFGELFVVIKLFGAAYLIWLGLKIFFSTLSSKTESHHLLCERRSKSGNYLGGLLITLSNPKVILFYCGFLPTLLDVSLLTFLDIVMLVCVLSIVLSAVMITYAYAASRARYIFSSHLALKGLNRAAGCVMIATGLVIANES